MYVYLQRCRIFFLTLNLRKNLKYQKQCLSMMKQLNTGDAPMIFSSALAHTSLFSGSNCCSTERMLPSAGLISMDQPFVKGLGLPWCIWGGFLGILSPTPAQTFVRTFSCPSSAIAVIDSGLAGGEHILVEPRVVLLAFEGQAEPLVRPEHALGVDEHLAVHPDQATSSGRPPCNRTCGSARSNAGSHRSWPPSCCRIPSWPRTGRGRPCTSTATSGHQRSGCRRRGCPGMPTRETGR